MRKIVGKDGDKINAVKLCKDFEDAGLKDFLVEVDPETKDVYVSYEFGFVEIDEIIKAHDPTPLPEPKSEMEELTERVELLDGTLTEVLFNIIPTLQGGA